MKYICMLSGDDTFEIFPFPRTVNHDVMAEILTRLKDQTHGNWQRITRTVISAGFVTAGGKCYGESETLGLESRGDEDTALLAKQYA